MKFHHLIDVQSGPAARPDAPPGAPGAVAGPGLVTSHTSGTSEGLVELDPFLTRLRRLRRSVLTAARMHEWSTAIEHFEIALAVLTSADPRRDQALVGLAEANLELGDVSAAATRLREVDPSLLARDASMVAEVDALRARITAAEAERIGSPE